MKPLVLITDGGRLRTEGRLVEVLSKALQGASGQVESVVLREQLVGAEFSPLGDTELLKLAKQIREHCDEHGAKLILHSNEGLYKKNLKLFSGLHLNKYSSDISRVSEKGVFGYSAHDKSECLKAEAARLDYTFLSPVFPPNSKKVDKILGLKSFRKIKSKISIPLVALGGITPDKAYECAKAGADSVAVISSILYSDHPAIVAEQVVEEFLKAN